MLDYSFFTKNIKLISESNSVYINKYFQSIVVNKSGMRCSGTCVAPKNKYSIIPAIGEYFERENLLCTENEKKFGISLLTKEKVDLLAAEIQNKNLFLDSCGMATHVISSDCITNAMDEFIERQSFIFNYLSKSKGKIIENDRIKEYILDSKSEVVSTKFEQFKFFNISLIQSYYVILAFGICDYNFYIGLGSSYNFKLALSKCIKELEQFNQLYTKQKIPKVNKKTFPEYMDYMDYFLLFTSEELFKAYSYLLDSKELELIEEKSDKSLRTILNELKETCGIEPILVYMASPRKQSGIKTVKIIDLNWFSGLNPNYYTESMFEFIEEKMKVSLDKNCNFIPFP